MAYETSRSTPNGPLLLAGLSLLPQLLKAASASGDQAFKPMSGWSPIRAQGATGGFSSGWSQGSQVLFSSVQLCLTFLLRLAFSRRGIPQAPGFHQLFSSYIYGGGENFFFFLKKVFD